MPKDAIRQRKPHHKTKDGCLTCRQRHIKCDETKPECRNCLGRQLQCGGYDRAKPKPFDGRLAPAPTIERSTSHLVLESVAAADQSAFCLTPDDALGKSKLAGCLTCDKRRMRCDRKMPNCTRCIKATLLCEGYASVSTLADDNIDVLVSRSHISEGGGPATGSSAANTEWFLLEDRRLKGNRLLQESGCERSIATFSSPSEVLSWLNSYNIRLPELDHFQAPFPIAAFDTPYASLRHIYAATVLHSLALEIPVLTPSMLAEIRMLALDQEICAIQALRTENPPLAITALTAFLFAWVEVWQGSWDSGIPHLRQAMGLVSKRNMAPTMPANDFLLQEVGDFIEAFARCVPSVLQCKKALQVMPEIRTDGITPSSTAANTLRLSNHQLNMEGSFGFDIHDLDAEYTDSSCYYIPPAVPERHGACRYAFPRLAYATFHAHRALLWATGVFAETSRLARHPLPRTASPQHSNSLEACSPSSLATQTQHIRALLKVMHAKLSALLSVWAEQGTGQLELPSSLKDLESPFAACMKHLSLFLGRKAGFDLRLWEGQCRSSVKFVCLFAIGAGEEQEGLRGDVLGVLRKGVEVRRGLGLDRERISGTHGQQSEIELRVADELKCYRGPEVQWIHTTGLD